MVKAETHRVSLSDPALYISRDISLLEFQRRVLDQARDKKTPLLERVKFLAIFGSNMDEFFMLRISGLQRSIQILADAGYQGLAELDENCQTPCKKSKYHPLTKKREAVKSFAGSQADRH